MMKLRIKHLVWLEIMKREHFEQFDIHLKQEETQYNFTLHSVLWCYLVEFTAGQTALVSEGSMHLLKVNKSRWRRW